MICWDQGHLPGNHSIYLDVRERAASIGEAVDTGAVETATRALAMVMDSLPAKLQQQFVQVCFPNATRIKARARFNWLDNVRGTSL